MRAKGSTNRLAVAVLAAGLLMLQGLLYAQTRPFEQLVPEDVTSFASVRNYRALVEKLKNTPYYALTREPEVKALVEQITGKFRQQLELSGRSWDIKLADVEGLLSGEIAMASVSKVEAQEPGMMAPMAFPRMQTAMLVLVDVGQNAPAAEQFIGRLLRIAEEEGVLKQTEEEEFRGHKIRRLTFDPLAFFWGGEKLELAHDLTGDEGLEELPPELQERLRELKAAGVGEAQNVYINLEGNVLAVETGGDRSLLERHLVLRDGGEMRALSQSVTYRRLTEMMDPDSDYITFQNLEPVWEQWKQMIGQASPFLPVNPVQVMEATGLLGLKAKVDSVRIEEDGILSESFVLAPAPRRGLLKAVVPAGRANVKPPAFVGQDVSLYCGAYFDVPTLWEEVKAAIKELSPQGYELMMQQINSPLVPFHVERDLIQTVGSHWFVYVPREFISPNPPREINALLAVELKDSRKLETRFQTLWAMAPLQAPDSTVEFMGKTIYQSPPVPLDRVPGFEVEMAPLRFSFVFADGKLIIATSTAMAKRAVRDSLRSESPLLQKAEFRATLLHMISRPESIYYMDLRAIGEAALKGVEKLMDLSEAKVSLPSYETLGKYLYVSATTTKWSEDGLHVKQWWAFPPE